MNDYSCRLRRHGGASAIAIHVAILATLSVVELLGQDDSLTRPVRQIDHIMIRSDDPNGLFELFSEVFQLPIAWPLATRGGVTSGGIGFGNVNVEAIKLPGQNAGRTVLVGLALEPSPSLQRSLVELERRQISHGEPRPFVVTNPEGANQTLWTNVTLTQFSDADRPVSARMHIFLSEYAPTYVDVDQRRRRLQEALMASSGGPLGVSSVAEVVVGTTDLDASKELWGALMEPQDPSAPGLWQLGGGPAIRLVPAERNELQGFVIAVASLQRAETFLRENALLGSATKEGLTIDASKIEGLNIRLIEKK